MYAELLTALYFLLVGICGCLYPFLFRDSPKKFDKSNNMYCDGDNT